jgi:branched-chain amino acid transport system ATP-binding protein
MALLEIDDVTVRFGGLVALRDVAFEVDEGQFISIIGPNGAGKTTLFNAIAGTVRPTSGRIRFRGREVQGSRAAHMSHVGVRRTFQVARPFPSMTVRENVYIAAAGRSVLHSARSLGLRGRVRTLGERVDGLLQTTGLTSEAGRRASELNIGGLRRLEIARALASEPTLLLLDEPAAGIGVDGLRPLADLIRDVHQRGLTVLLVEHYVGFALSLSDRVIVLDEGVLIAEGTPEQVRNDERVITAYLGRAGRAAKGEQAGLAPEIPAEPNQASEAKGPLGLDELDEPDEPR